MKFLLIFFITVSFSIRAQKKLQRKNLPSGFEWVKSRNLLVSQFEITCANWIEYLKDTGPGPEQLPERNGIVARCVYSKKGDDIIVKDLRTLYRDTTFIDISSGKKKKIRGTENCSDMPVTGVSYEQALAYCEWLSDQHAGDSKYNSLKLNFRLPTPEEMDSLLQDTYRLWPKDDENAVAFQEGINKQGCALYNHKHNSWCETNIRMKNEFGYAVPIKNAAFFPDKNGLYDLMGNVAEMTSEKGIAKGGSCISSSAECQPGAVNSYDGPKTWLGFRVVAVLKE